VATLLMGGVGELGNTLRARGDVRGAIAQYRDAVAVGESLLARGSGASRVKWTTAQIGQLLADALVLDRDYAAAERALATARRRVEELRAAEPGNVEYLRSVADVLVSEGELRQARGRAGGVARYREAVATYRAIAARTGLSQDRQTLAHTQYELALALRRAGETAEARRELLDARRQLLELRTAGQLSDASEGYRLYLPAIDSAIVALGR
jgi:tetratricopeptide (TPR) repeat protein